MNWDIKNCWFILYEGVICIVPNEWIATIKKKYGWRKHQSKI